MITIKCGTTDKNPVPVDKNVMPFDKKPWTLISIVTLKFITFLQISLKMYIPICIFVLASSKLATSESKSVVQRNNGINPGIIITICNCIQCK